MNIQPQEIKNLNKIKRICDIFSEEELNILRDAGVKVFAKKAGVSPIYVYMIREGKREIKSEKSKRVLQVLLMFLEFYLKNIETINKK